MSVAVPDHGIIQLPSHRSVEETVHRFKTLLQQKGVTIFADIDQQHEAEAVGLNLRPTRLLIFGSPKAGTPIMQQSPTSALDLPLKLVVWEDDSGKVWTTFNGPEFLRERHGLSPASLAVFGIVGQLADSIRQ